MLLCECVACGQMHQTDPASIRAGAPVESESREWYQTATFRRASRARGHETVRLCEIVPRDSTVAIAYRCDAVVLVLRPSVTVQAISGLLADVSATVERVYPGPRSVAYVRVPAGTELEAIGRAYADSNVAHAGLSLERTGALP